MVRYKGCVPNDREMQRTWTHNYRSKNTVPTAVRGLGTPSSIAEKMGGGVAAGTGSTHRCIHNAALTRQAAEDKDPFHRPGGRLVSVGCRQAVKKSAYNLHERTW